MQASRGSFLSWAISAAILLTGSEAYAGKNNRVDYVEIPGASKRPLFDKLWSRAKKVCYESNYEEFTEDKSEQILICKQQNMSFFIQFEEDQISLRIDNTFSKMPLVGGIFSSPKNHKKKMAEALRVEAKVGASKR